MRFGQKGSCKLCKFHIGCWSRHQAVGQDIEFAIILEKVKRPLQGAVPMRATTANFAFAAVWDLEIHKCDDGKPTHIMLVIKCSKIMQAVTLHCDNAEGGLLRLHESILCLDYTQAIASVDLWFLAIFTDMASSSYPPHPVLTMLHLSSAECTAKCQASAQVAGGFNTTLMQPSCTTWLAYSNFLSASWQLDNCDITSYITCDEV